MPRTPPFVPTNSRFWPVAFLSISSPWVAGPAIAAEPATARPPQLATELLTQERLLPNGSQLVVTADPHLALGAIVHRFAGGSGAELPGEGGGAHLLEHLMFDGTQAHPSGTWDDAMDDVGALRNAYTSPDETVYHSTAPAGSFLAILDLEIERFAGSQFDEASVERERKVVLDEGRVRNELEPDGRVARQLQSQAMAGHAYAREIGGTDASVSLFTRSRVEALRARTYVGQNLIVTVVSPFDATAVIELLAAAYGGIAAGERAAPVAPVDPRALATPITVGDPASRQAWDGMLWRLPPAPRCPLGVKDDAGCDDTGQADAVAFALLEREGRRVIADRLAAEGYSWAPITVWSWRGEAGGWVAVLVRRRSFMGAFRNTADQVRLELSRNADRWVTAEAISRAQASVSLTEMRRAWDPLDRALAMAEAVASSTAPNTSIATVSAELDREAVLLRYHRIFDHHGVPLHVR